MNGEIWSTCLKILFKNSSGSVVEKMRSYNYSPPILKQAREILNTACMHLLCVLSKEQ